MPDSKKLRRAFGKFWDSLEDSQLDKALKVAEAGVCIALVLMVTVSTLAVIVWIITGWEKDQIHRMADSIRFLNENWKVGLILTVPLFYRTIRRFLARVTKLPGGVEAGPEDEKIKPEVSPKKHNPPAEEQT